MNTTSKQLNSQRESKEMKTKWFKLGGEEHFTSKGGRFLIMFNSDTKLWDFTVQDSIMGVHSFPTIELAKSEAVETLKTFDPDMFWKMMDEK